MADEKTKLERVYERLVDLYPSSFKERFRESMLQTFSDLYREERSLRSIGSSFATFCEDLPPGSSYRQPDHTTQLNVIERF